MSGGGRLLGTVEYVAVHGLEYILEKLNFAGTCVDFANQEVLYNIKCKCIGNISDIMSYMLVLDLSNEIVYISKLLL